MVRCNACYVRDVFVTAKLPLYPCDSWLPLVLYTSVQWSGFVHVLKTVHDATLHTSPCRLYIYDSITLIFTFYCVFFHHFPSVVSLLSRPAISEVRFHTVLNFVVSYCIDHGR